MNKDVLKGKVVLITGAGSGLAGFSLRPGGDLHVGTARGKPMVTR